MCEARAAELAAFMDDWYDRWAGPDERWTFEEMAAGIVEWQASREVIPYAGPGPRYVVDTNELASRAVTEAEVRRQTIESLLDHARARREECRETVVVSGCYIRREPYGDQYWTEVTGWLEREHAAALEAAREVRSCICGPAIAGISDGPSVDCEIHGEVRS